MRKGIIICIAVVSLLTFSGCGHSHEWKEATCIEPKTCLGCGEAEGETLGHTWVEATCAEPKNCSVCGVTEGETLEHTLTEANYQQAATCTVCGATVGKPIQADFEKYGLECNVELNKIYDSVTMCYNDEDKTTIAKTVFTNYQIFDSDEQHPAVEGYEWRTVDIVKFFYDDNAMQDGWKNGECYEDYYDIIGRDASNVWNEDDYNTFTVNYMGKEYTECKFTEEAIEDKKISYDDTASSIRAWKVLYQVPKGYEGCVYGVRNAQIEWGEEQHINDLDNTDTLFFRFVNQEDLKQASELNVSDINLPYDVAVKVINNFAMNMLNYFDDDIIGYFDTDGNMNISQEESQYLLFWALDNYNTEKSKVLSEEATIKAAADYLAEKLNIPEKPYMPFEGEDITEISVEDAKEIINKQVLPYYESIMSKDKKAFSFYDLNGDGKLNDAELDRFYGWIFVHKDDKGNSSYTDLSDDEIIEFAKMWQSYKTVDNPDYYYYFQDGEQVKM